MTDTITAPLPLVTVIVPAFNAAEAIGETLQSIARQSYRDLEILIVDDGSTDETRELVLDFCASDARARLLAQANGGLAAARNAGLIAATGRFVAPIDADDLWHPDYVATLVQRLTRTDPPAVMAYAASRLINRRSRVIASALAVGLEGKVARTMLFHNMVGSAMMFDRDLALRLGGYDSRLRAAGAEGCEDLLLQLMLASHGPVEASTSFLVGYRQLPRQMSADGSRMARLEWLVRGIHGRATGLALPGRWDRWKRASAAMRRARASHEREKVADMMANLARAVRLDPVGVGMAFLSRLAASVRRFDYHRADLPLLLEVDPDQRDPAGVKALGRPSLYYWLHRRRVRRLASSRTPETPKSFKPDSR